MWMTIVNFLLTMLGSTQLQNIVVKALEKLLESRDSGITDRLVAAIVDIAVRSRLNKLTEEDAREIKAKLGIAS